MNKLFAMRRGSGAFVLLLFVLNVVWTCWNVHQSRSGTAGAKFIGIKVLDTNHVYGILLYEKETGRPLWTGFWQDATKVTYTLFYDGKEVFHITGASNQPPKCGAWLRGKGEAATWWIDRGSGSFTERITYDADGFPVKREVWYQGQWYPVERRGQTKGIVVNERWRPLRLDINGTWTIDSEGDE